MSSNCGSRFGLYLKKAGYDAHTRWGTGTVQCREMLSDRLNYDAYSCLCIGPAGEDLLPAATVISDGRAAGRAGFGAVLGWKNLKAITVSGNKAIPLFDPIKAAEEIQNWNRLIQQNPLTSDPSKISSCPGCPIRCKKPGKDPEPILNDLGSDSIDAQNHLTWLWEKHGVTPENTSTGKSGQRRSKFYRSILESLEIQDCDETHQAYQELADFISTSGLCIFTIIVCLNSKHGSTPLTISDRLPKLLQYSTGIRFQKAEPPAIESTAPETMSFLQEYF